MSALAPAARARRARTNGITLLVAGILALLIGVLSLAWWIAIIGVLVALAGVYGLRRAGQLRRLA